MARAGNQYLSTRAIGDPDSLYRCFDSRQVSRKPWSREKLMELGARPAPGSVPIKNRDLKNGSRVNARPGPVPGLALAKTSHVKVPYSSRPVVSEIHEGLVS